MEDEVTDSINADSDPINKRAFDTFPTRNSTYCFPSAATISKDRKSITAVDIGHLIATLNETGLALSVLRRDRALRNTRMKIWEHAGATLPRLPL
jgi:hypothetical protein